MYRQPGMRLVVHEEHGYTRMVMIPADDTLTEQNSYTVRKQARRGVFVITDRVAPAAGSAPAAEDAETGWGSTPAEEEPPASLFADSVATDAPR